MCGEYNIMILRFCWIETFKQGGVEDKVVYAAADALKWLLQPKPEERPQSFKDVRSRIPFIFYRLLNIMLSFYIKVLQHKFFSDEGSLRTTQAHFAAAIGNAQKLQELLEANASLVKCTDFIEDTLLHAGIYAISKPLPPSPASFYT